MWKKEEKISPMESIGENFIRQIVIIDTVNLSHVKTVLQTHNTY